MPNIISTVDALQLVVAEEVEQLSLSEYPMVSRLNKKTISQKQIKWNVNVGGASATGALTTANVTGSSVDTVVTAILPIGGSRFQDPFQLQKEDIAQAKSVGRGALRDLVGSDIQSGVRVIMEALSTAIYTGTGVAGNVAVDGGVVGLVTAGAASGAYAGIDPATYTKWASFVSSNGSNRALTQALLFDVETGITRKGGNFSAIYMNPELCQKYKSVFTASVTQMASLGGRVDLGYTGLEFAGRPIIKDIYCPANSIYFVNEPMVDLYTYSQDGSEGKNGLQFSITDLPSSNPDALIYVVTCKAQLKVANRAKAVAALLNITQ